MLNGTEIPTFEPGRKYTHGEALGAAAFIETGDEATEYLRRLADYYARSAVEGMIEGKTPSELALWNIGYYAAYFNAETRDRIYRLFGTRHPVAT